MSDRPLIYDLHIETLSPVHIGTGHNLLREYDYVVEKEQTWVIDRARFAEELLAEGENSQGWQELASGQPSGSFLRREDFVPDSPFFRYMMPGVPSTKSRGAELNELIKTPWDEPYLPGSSLKGAFRTAFLYTAFAQLKLKFNPREHMDDRRAKFAAQPLEKLIAGKDPNHDILRAMHVADSAPGSKDALTVVNAAVVKPGRDASIPIPLEAIRQNSSFTAQLRLDQALLKRIVPGTDELRWDSERQVKWLRGIRQCANFLAAQRLATERQYWGDSVPALRGYYKQLESVIDGQPKNAFLIQLGWGGGWDSKTFGDHLTGDEVFSKVMGAFGNKMDRQKNWTPGDPFPKTRRVALHKDTGQPLHPLGWVQVKMEKRS